MFGINSHPKAPSGKAGCGGFGWGKSAAELFNGLCVGSGSEIVVERNNCRTNKVLLVATVPSHLICLGEGIVSAFGCSELLSYHFTWHYSKHSLQ